jgi:hypothetical protein
MKFTQNIQNLTLIIILGLVSCDKQTHEFTDSPIVEAYLTAGDHPKVTITRQIPFIEDAGRSVDNIDSLNVVLISDQETITLKPFGNGIYMDSNVIVRDSGTYTIQFSFNQKTVSATTTIPVKPLHFKQSAVKMNIVRMDSTSGPPSTMSDPITLSWTNSDESTYLIVIENLEDVLDPIRYFSDEDSIPTNFFRQQPTNTSEAEIRPMDFQYFGTHRIILYHVLPDYANLYIQSTSNSQNLTNPSTMITNGFGIFTGLSADTLYIRVIEVD